VLDDADLEAVGPDGELVDGGGAEGVAGGWASLAMEVVLPTPLTPQTRMTVGGLGAQRMSLPFSVRRFFRSALSQGMTWSVVLISPFL
jgi:hypothetical protein